MALGGSSREFVLKIVADVKDATKGMDQVEKSSDSMKSKITGVGKAVVGGLAIGAVVSFGRASVEAAADAEQAMNGVRAVFGDSADQIEAFSSKAITNMGISDDAFQSFATTTGGLLKDMGVPMEDTVTMTNELAQRGADLAAVYGVDAETAFTAMQKAMGGSTKGLKQLGISLSKNEVDARAMSEGWVDAEGNVTSAGRAMATQALIMEKTADKAGAFAQHSGEVANQQKILALQFEETQETVGTALLPVLSKLLAIFVPLLTFTAQYADILVPIAAIIAGIVGAYKAVTIATTVWTAAQWAWNAAMTANPIGLIVLAIAAVVAAVVILYKKVDWFRQGVDTAVDGIVAAWNWVLRIVQTVFNWVRTNWPLLLAIITGPIGLAVYAIVRNWDTIKLTVSNAISAIKGFLANVWHIISEPFRRGAGLIGDNIDAVRNAMFKLPGQIGYFFTNMANTISAPFRAAFQAIKNLWNSTVGGFGFTVPSWVPGLGGKGWKIPHMAAGGVVSRPTIALIGEAGPEAVIPLGKSGLGGTTVINVYALTANAEVGRRVWESLREYERTSGKALA
jgi:hypothetical protein